MTKLSYKRFKYFYIMMLCVILPLFGTLAEAQQKEVPLTQDERELAGQINRLFRRAVEQVRPAVVSLIVSKRSEWSEDIPFFGPERTEGLGSGVIIDERGYVITCNHVVKDADEIKVILADGRRFIAEEKMLDAETDLAVVRIDPKDEELPVARFGDSDKAEVGDFVLAMGSPFGLPQTITAGIISYRGRQTNILGPWGYEDFIQTDAEINKGNSGGPLVSLYGEIVGINSSILTPTGISAGYGFSIPSKLARNISQQLIENKKVERGWLGVNMVDLGNAREKVGRRGAREALAEIPASVKGVWIVNVVEGSPAYDAGLKRYDVVVRMNDKEYTEQGVLRDYIATLPPGTLVQFLIWRVGGEKQIELALGDRAAARAEEEQALRQAQEWWSRNQDRGSRSRQREQQQQQQQEEAVKLGISVSYLTPEITQKLGYEEDIEGIYIKEVNRRSLAEEAGLREGDIIISVDDQEIKTTEQLVEIIKKADLKKGIRMKILNRQGTRICIIQKDPILER